MQKTAGYTAPLECGQTEDFQHLEARHAGLQPCLLQHPAQLAVIHARQALLDHQADWLLGNGLGPWQGVYSHQILFVDQWLA